MNRRMKTEKIKILIAKNDPEYCAALTEQLEAVGRFEVLPPVYESAQVLDRLKQGKPDLLLLGAAMEGGDGIELLRKIRGCSEGRNTAVIVITPVINDKVVALYRNLDAAFVLHSRATVRAAFSRIVSLTMHDEAGRKLLRQLFIEERELQAKNITTAYIRAMGLQANLAGYNQVREAILYCVRIGSCHVNLSKDVYVEVARKTKATPKQAERNIRTVIDVAWSNPKFAERHEKYFGNTISAASGRPTNKEFITIIADKVIGKLRNS